MSIFSERFKRFSGKPQRSVSRSSYEARPETTGFSFAKKESESELKNVVGELKDNAVKNGERVLSSYRAPDGTKFWIITEWDRSYTTVLLPEEY